MAKDIEEFLRMAAARRRDAQSRPQATPQRPPQQKTPPKQKKPPVKPSLVVSDSEVEVVSPRRESVARHVESHLDTSRLGKHAEKLGERVGRADDILESRLHQKFDHKVGRLAKPEIGETPAEPQREPIPPLLAMLVSPQGVRQAIMMNEILKRPEWD